MSYRIRIYPGDAEVNDRLQRGDFLGERRQTITYLQQQPGTFVLPALTYVWWNAWRNAQDLTFPPDPGRRAAVLGLQRHLFGPTPAAHWRGDVLGRAFTEHLTAKKSRYNTEKRSFLPLLNPHD